MSYYDILREHAAAVDLDPADTSYFSKPSSNLDPRLFRDGTLLSAVREGILVLLYNHLKLGYNEPEAWTKVWLAGSGVSFNWEAAREPGDLDCLIGVNYVQFRQSNQEYKGWSDAEISAEINQGFRQELHPRSNNFMGTFELTFYVNVKTDITELRPYAAYSVLDNVWVVPPTEDVAPVNPEWGIASERDKERAIEIIKRYADALEKVKNSPNNAMRVNAETALANAVHQGAALFEDIHESRNAAFSQGGSGYYDFANYRWQAGKQSGVVSAMKKLKEMSKEAQERFSTETYGVELPDVSTLIRRSAIR
jgi:hypothetical protein